MTLSEDIKAALPIIEEFQHDGHELRRMGSRLVCLCPLHQERTPSCYVTPNNGRFFCFGCGASGTVIDYHARKRGITPAEAIAQLALRLRIPASATNGSKQRSKPKLPDPRPRPRASPKLPDLHSGTAAEFTWLSECRRVSVDALKLASSRGLLWFCDIADGPDSVRAWVLADRTRKNAQVRRLDGERWHHAWDADAKSWLLVEPQQRRRKVRGFTGNQACWPVGLEEAQPFKSIAILEGADLLAAFHFLIAEGREDAVAPMTILGASNRIPNDALKLFTGKRVRIFPHADSNHAGLRAAANWETQLRPVVASVDAFDFTGLIQIGGSGVKDLNDVTNIDPDCFEAERDTWSMMNF